MDYKDRISVIVPIYNNEKYLDRCIKSLISQTYINLEILLIDDGSTDNSRIICEKYCNNDFRCKYIYQENRGVSAARNLGIEHSTGDLIGFCDGDDWVAPDMYYFLYDMLYKANADVAVCGHDVLDSNGKSKTQEYDYELQIADSEQAIITIFANTIYGGFSWNKLVKSSLLKSIRFDEQIAMFEDMIFAFELYHKADKIVFQNYPKYHYCQNDASVTNSFKDSIWSGLEARKKLLELTKSNYPTLISMAQKSVLEGSIWIANKVAKGNLLDKANYKRIRSTMKLGATNEAKRLLSRRYQLMVNIFLRSRRLYYFCGKITGKI